MLDFHFGIEVNLDYFLWVHGSVGNHAWRWTLRHFWRIDHWLLDDTINVTGGDDAE